MSVWPSNVSVLPLPKSNTVSVPTTSAMASRSAVLSAASPHSASWKRSLSSSQSTQVLSDEFLGSTDAIEN